MNLIDIKAFAASLESKELPSEDGTPYTTRYIVRKTDAGSVYLQNIHRADLDPAMHNHPWRWMRATILHGAYVQERGAVVGNQYCRLPTMHGREGYSYEMAEHDLHRIVQVERDTWTLLFVGPKRDNWGFWVEGRGWVPWQQRFEERGVKL